MKDSKKNEENGKVRNGAKRKKKKRKRKEKRKKYRQNILTK